MPDRDQFIDRFNDAGAFQVDSGELLLDRVKIGHLNVSYAAEDVIEVSRIEVSKPYRGQGYARGAMEQLLEISDELGLTVALTPSSDWGSSKERLTRFYASLGFVKNQGRKKDFRFRATMYREPRKPTLHEMRDATSIDTLVASTNARYPRAGREVDGRLVRTRVPNLNSIDGYFAESQTLSGVRVFPMSDLGGPRTVFYAADDFERSERLADAIRASGEINPLIIGVDKEGPFIIEGAHRYVALYYLKATAFPAVVVVGDDG